MNENAVRKMQAGVLAKQLLDERRSLTPEGGEGLTLECGLNGKINIPKDHVLFDQLKDAILFAYDKEIVRLKKYLSE